MPQKKHTPEEIVVKLRRFDVLLDADYCSPMVEED